MIKTECMVFAGPAWETVQRESRHLCSGNDHVRAVQQQPQAAPSVRPEESSENHFEACTQDGKRREAGHACVSVPAALHLVYHSK